MFTRLWQAVSGLFRGSGKDELDRLDIYKPSERLIYSFFDGTRQRRVDPLPLYKRLKEVWPELSADIRVSGSPSKGADEAHRRMVAKCYDVFEVKPFVENGGTSDGLGEVEVLDLLDHFLAYTGGVKKNLSRPVTSAEETPASTASSPAEESPIPNTSVSGSTEGVPSTDSPSPSPREQESPSEASHQIWATLRPSQTERERPS